MTYIKPADVLWKQVRYLKEPLSGEDDTATWKYQLWLNAPLSEWDVFSYWEKERIASMEEHLQHGDVLYDVGTEQGWCNLVYAQMVGPENMVLIEPTREFWPNIKALWNKNLPRPPRATYAGFVGDENSLGDQGVVFPHDFPPEAKGDLIDRNKYQYLHESEYEIPCTTIDALARMGNMRPDALTIDTEGSELLILKGAVETLRRGVKLWVSIHDDLALRDYGVKPGEVADFLYQLGYTGEHLATDHEAHWYFEKGGDEPS